MKIQRSCCNALIGTEQEQINQLYEIVKALAGNYFEGFELMGTYDKDTNYDKKYMLVFYNGATYVKTVDGDSINFSPYLHPDKWALFTYPAQGERGPKGEGATVAELAEKIEGSETIVIDENEAGTALEVRLDAEVVNKIDRAILTPTAGSNVNRLPYIDSTKTVKYALLNGNVGISNGRLMAQTEGKGSLFLHTFKFILNGGADVLIIFAPSYYAEPFDLMTKGATPEYFEALEIRTFQGVYIENVEGETPTLIPTSAGIQANGEGAGATFTVFNTMPNQIALINANYGKQFNQVAINIAEFVDEII